MKSELRNNLFDTIRINSTVYNKVTCIKAMMMINMTLFKVHNKYGMYEM